RGRVVIAHISNDAYHSHPYVAVKAALDAAPQWALALEHQARESRADDRDRLGLVQITLAEVTAGDKRNAHRREIPGAGEPESGLRELVKLAAAEVMHALNSIESIRAV